MFSLHRFLLPMIPSTCSMPGVQDWRMTPLVNVTQLFEEHTKTRNQNLVENRIAEAEIHQQGSARNNESEWKNKVSSFFEEKLKLSSQDVEWRKQIPSLNLTANHLLTDGQMVRFQGMIQVFSI